MSAKSVIIGVDGATYDILDPLMAEGLMPNLAALIAGGARGILKSTIHPLTPPAWTTLMTGVSPGTHGIFDFIKVDRSGAVPSYTLATSEDVKVPTLWDIASARGKRVTTLNFPVMFPARPIDGVVIPGYVPWSYLGRAIHPRSMAKRLKELGVFKASEMSTDWQHERKAVQGLGDDQLDDWVNFHITRERRWQATLLAVMAEDPCDLTAVLFDGVDRIQHLCWHLIDPATRADYASPANDATRALVLQYFSELDGFIGEILAKAGQEARVFIVSDHGFTRAGTRIFYANTWLEHQGLLAWKPDTAMDDQGRMALDENTEASTLIDWAGTKAYALSSSSNAIFIRVAKSAGEPGVQPQDYADFRADLVQRLLAFVDPATGRPVVAEVHQREAAFPGPNMTEAPDLTLRLHDYSFLSVLRADQPCKDRRVAYATHHPDGIFVAHGPGIRAGEEIAALRIADITPTVLYSLGLPVAQSMEGQAATGAFTIDHLMFNALSVAAEAMPGGAAQTGNTGEALPEDAAEEIKERLKALGYM